MKKKNSLIFIQLNLTPDFHGPAPPSLWPAIVNLDQADAGAVAYP